MGYAEACKELIDFLLYTCAIAVTLKERIGWVIGDYETHAWSHPPPGLWRAKHPTCQCIQSYQRNYTSKTEINHSSREYSAKKINANHFKPLRFEVASLSIFM